MAYWRGAMIIELINYHGSHRMIDMSIERGPDIAA